LNLITAFDYPLPQHKIALHPLPNRDDSKLLVNKNNQYIDSHFKHIGQFLHHNSLIFLNNTKVIRARILFEKNTGSHIEIFCLEPATSLINIEQAMQCTQTVQWKCLVGGAKKWKEEYLIKIIEIENVHTEIKAKIISQEADYFIVAFYWNTTQPFAKILQTIGNIPLPPYIKRGIDPTDKDHYQTVYAKHQGSVAAPTAGLHFTAPLLQQLLQQKNIAAHYTTLHVGAGTFMPVKTEQVQQHIMHSEWICIDIDTIHTLLQRSTNNIIAVGTTTLRTLESLYWIGVKALHQKNTQLHNINLLQWDAYNLPQNISVTDSLHYLQKILLQNNQTQCWTTTQLIIMPTYPFKIVDTLITNFHQPQSTLLLLVSAFIGDGWKKMYEHALQNEYRFLSYGDACLLQRE
jgi:S-adenosylmethionine:tRNA ribosyltransferase-isomerase